MTQLWGQQRSNTHTPPQLAFSKFRLYDVAVSRAIHDVKATDLGLSKVRFKAEVDFDGRVVTRSYLEKQDIDQILNVSSFNPDPLSLSLFREQACGHHRWRQNSISVGNHTVLSSLQEIQQVKTPEELENFMLKHGENIIDTLGAEVDRLEKGLKVHLWIITCCHSYWAAVNICVLLLLSNVTQRFATLTWRYYNIHPGSAETRLIHQRKTWHDHTYLCNLPPSWPRWSTPPSLQESYCRIDDSQIQKQCLGSDH